MFLFVHMNIYMLLHFFVQNLSFTHWIPLANIAENQMNNVWNISDSILKLISYLDIWVNSDP